MKEKSTNSERVIGITAWTGGASRPLFSADALRELETRVALDLPPHTLMQRAGLAVARLALAVAPHARHIWVACGPGNNGGDGFEAAHHLKLLGKRTVVTCACDPRNLPWDAAASRRRALEAGVEMTESVPSGFDLCIDALFGIGAIRQFQEPYLSWIKAINSSGSPVLAVDIPSGLNSDTGAACWPCVHADFTLSLLALKPGLFTAGGRDACGEIWLNSLNVSQPAKPCAVLNSQPGPFIRKHNSHKGSFGDVAIVGGASGMEGAATLAATAALHGGAGRVYVCFLDSAVSPLSSQCPEVMCRSPDGIIYQDLVVVAGCGGGNSIKVHLPRIILESSRLVLDADALNAIAADKALQQIVVARRPSTTVLTPHPLEAARLLNSSSHEVQANRTQAAQAIADRFACTVVLKGSGTIIASPGTMPRINPTGNAKLATAGTGDVLAGLIGARIAGGGEAFEAACDSAYRHGSIADTWRPSSTLTAHSLAKFL